ncbi:hypothetical protein GCM10022414_24680 [Zhongshania borealis]|uniref:DUF2141 domain-containing protein n=1 Tax=Zhongshania borealis TaxID=889488 RepID=A0ABP7WWJ2_9GAMM|tara:strand:+ start:2094 stop:2558 length:465 start_codon:yes stop_codon:yes gene_type:complete
MRNYYSIYRGRTLKKFTLAVFSSLMLASPAYAETVALSIEVDGIKHSTGSLAARVYNKDNWLSDSPIMTKVLPMPSNYKGGPLQIDIELEAGRYAFAVYHDVDGSGAMNKNFIGLPEEPVGLSNDHRPRFGPPRYKKAELSINADTKKINITLD